MASKTYERPRWLSEAESEAIGRQHEPGPRWSMNLSHGRLWLHFRGSSRRLRVYRPRAAPDSIVDDK